MSKKYAYWRVSTKEQNEARQLKAFAECGEEFDHIFGDKESGKNLDRDDYKKLIEVLAPGDLVVIKSLDRLSRKYDDIAAAWDYITRVKKADILVLDMREILDTRRENGLMGKVISEIVVKLLSYVAETERENIRQRQAEGIAAMPVDNKGRRVSKKTGGCFGPAEIRPENFEEVYARQQRGEIKLAEALKLVGIGRTKWYELAREAVSNA